MEKIRTSILLIPFFVLFAWLMYCVNFTRTAQEVVLPIRGYDPRNLLSGHYIQFQIDWNKTDCHQLDWNGNCPYSDFKDIDRFYIPEKKTKKLEYLINNKDTIAEIVFAYQKGRRPIAKKLLINAQPVLNKEK